MGRLETPFASGTLRVEEWRIPRTSKWADYIEVSFRGNNDPADAGEFQTVVETLVAKGITPLANGMTALATACRERKK